MRLLLLCGLVLWGAQAQAFKIQYYGETSIPYLQKFSGTKIGGLSGMAYQDGLLWAVSDDKGQYGPSRIYQIELSITGKNITLTPKKIVSVQSPPPQHGEADILDLEGLVRLADGSFVLSTENNTDKKPRIFSRLFQVSPEGKYQADIPLPERFQPEVLGQQKKGLKNNAAFEGLSQWNEGETLFAMAEGGLLTDADSAGAERGSAEWVRLLKFKKNAQKKYVPVHEYAYLVDKLRKNEVLRGVSEILVVNENRILVLERGLLVLKTGLEASVSLYSAELQGAADVSHSKNLSQEKTIPVKKNKLLDFKEDLGKERPGKSMQNFEALAWGPALPNGKRSLLVLADDNFSKKQITEFLVFSVEE